MKKKLKDALIGSIIGLIIGILAGLFLCKGKPVESVKVERDTIVKYDTIPSILPKPKDSVLVKWATIKVPFERIVYVNHPPNDSIRIDTIEAELPITQKHYQNDNYQAWVSGVMPNLDSIEVYHKTQLVTETITITKKENKHFFLGVAGGGEYYNKKIIPFAEFGATFKKDKFGLGVAGGYHHINNTGEPYVRLKLNYDILSF